MGGERKTQTILGFGPRTWHLRASEIIVMMMMMVMMMMVTVMPPHRAERRTRW